MAEFRAAVAVCAPVYKEEGEVERAVNEAQLREACGDVVSRIFRWGARW